MNTLLKVFLLMSKKNLLLTMFFGIFCWGYLQKLFDCFFYYCWQIFFSHLNNFLIVQKICANSIIEKKLVIPNFFVIKQKKYAYYLIPKNIVNKQKYLVYFLSAVPLSLYTFTLPWTWLEDKRKHVFRE